MSLFSISNDVGFQNQFLDSVSDNFIHHNSHFHTSSIQSISVDQDTFDIFITEKEIHKRMRELAKEIERDYQGKQPIFIGLLNGAFIFMADLIRHIHSVEVEVDFYKLSSYGDAKISSGNVHLLKSVDATLKGREVIVVEDVVDSGLSITYIRNEIMTHEPKSLKFCALLYKRDVAKIDFKIDYVGFEIPKEFVIGYGLDIKQIKRNLPHIYKLRDSE
ncbi:MAG: hypoxanthine phosphoribosyltransferase [Chloroherpetonaceae bacterium]|nr:hypoxanthine phosphoribosyltransferase [Chloroherpetonaceae bacterium]